jgi:hypothetical protein
VNVDEYGHDHGDDGCGHAHDYVRDGGDYVRDGGDHGYDDLKFLLLRFRNRMFRT